LAYIAETVKADVLVRERHSICPKVATMHRNSGDAKRKASA
jgi:hypothetical protein